MDDYDDEPFRQLVPPAAMGGDEHEECECDDDEEDCHCHDDEQEVVLTNTAEVSDDLAESDGLDLSDADAVIMTVEEANDLILLPPEPVCIENEDEADPRLILNGVYRTADVPGLVQPATMTHVVNGLKVFEKFVDQTKVLAKKSRSDHKYRRREDRRQQAVRTKQAKVSNVVYDDDDCLPLPTM